MAHAESDPEFHAYLAAYREGLQKLGWTEGRNIRIDSRWGALDDAKARQRSAKELVELHTKLFLHKTLLRRLQCCNKHGLSPSCLQSLLIQLAAASFKTWHDRAVTPPASP